MKHELQFILLQSGCFMYFESVYKAGKMVIGAVSVQKVVFAIPATIFLWGLGIPENAEFTGVNEYFSGIAQQPAPILRGRMWYFMDRH
jgi:hypothetical protein